MKAQVIDLTPELAKKYLKNNTHNRDLSSSKLNEYIEALKKGHWKENGESLIIDINGKVKDGQHRLEAVVKSGIGYSAVLVTDVKTDVMHTIDTGKNRSLADMLKLNGFKSSSAVASVVKMIVPFERGERTGNSGRGSGSNTVTNSIGLEYAMKNRQNLEDLVRHALTLYKRSRTRVIAPAKLAFYMYVLGGYKNSDNIILFMKNLIGINMYEGNAASWLYGKLLSTKQDKVSLNSKWVLGVTIKAWNLFNSGDTPVRYIKYDVANNLPTVVENPMPKFDS